MLIKDMKVGQRLEICINRRGYQYRCFSKIEMVKGNKVFVTPITSLHRMLQFDAGDKVSIIYHFGGEGMWKWDLVTPENAVLDGESFHAFSSLKEGVSYNRRNAYRLPIGEEYVLHQYIPIPEAERNGGPEYRVSNFPALIKNLSETGVAFFCNQELQPGDAIGFEMPTGQGLLTCKGKVVRVVEERTTNYHKLFGCVLTEASKELKKYLFERQRLQLQKSRTIR